MTILQIFFAVLMHAVGIWRAQDNPVYQESPEPRHARQGPSGARQIPCLTFLVSHMIEATSNGVLNLNKEPSFALLQPLVTEYGTFLLSRAASHKPTVVPRMTDYCRLLTVDPHTTEGAGDVRDSVERPRRRAVVAGTSAVRLSTYSHIAYVYIGTPCAASACGALTLRT